MVECCRRTASSSVSTIDWNCVRSPFFIPRQASQSFTVIPMRLNGAGRNGRSWPWARTGKNRSVANGMS
jgi:hypothetical protein